MGSKIIVAINEIDRFSILKILIDSQKIKIRFSKKNAEAKIYNFEHSEKVWFQ